MIYPFLTLDDSTEIVHSEMLSDGRVKVYVEKPDAEDGFHNAICFLPAYSWTDVNGFSESEISFYQSIIEANAPLILCFSQEKRSAAAKNLQTGLKQNAFLK